MNEKEERLIENATKGFEDFKSKVLAKSNDEIFGMAFEINAKNEIFGYLCDFACLELDEDEVDVLLRLGDSIIETLYFEFLSADEASIMFYSDINEWVQEFCDEECYE